MNVVLLIARIVFASLFLMSALGHLTKTQQMGAYAKTKGVPFPVFSTAASGILLAAGGLSVLLGVWGDLGSLLLIVFLIPTNYYMHDYWKQEQGPGRQGNQVNFNKNAALIGAALAFFVVFAALQPGLTLTGPLWHLS